MPEQLLLVARGFFTFFPWWEGDFYKFILKKQLFKVYESIFTTDVAVFIN